MTSALGKVCRSTDLTTAPCPSTTGGPQRDPAVCILEGWRAGPANLWLRSAFGSQEVRLARVAFLPAAPCVLRSAAALTLMHDSPRDPVLQLEVPVYPILVFHPPGSICSHLQKINYSLEASDALSAGYPRTLGLSPRGRSHPCSPWHHCRSARDRDPRIPRCFAHPWFCRHRVELCTWSPRVQVTFWPEPELQAKPLPFPEAPGPLVLSRNHQPRFPCLSRTLLFEDFDSLFCQ